MRLHCTLGPALFALLAFALPGCRSVEPSVEHSIAEEPIRVDRMAWWREARFGMFVHWGLYALPAGQWNGRTDYGEWIRSNAQIPLEEYERFAERWNPARFDAGRWARLAADAGMRYMVVTTKHHDGFPLFDSKFSDWDVGVTPSGRDVMAEVAHACRANGIVPCWYYSIMDWHHPDYLPRRPWERDRGVAGADFARYEAYLSAQVTELLENYGPIGVMWFDGDWESTWTNERGARLYELCRRLQPDVIVNNRIGAGGPNVSPLAEGAGSVGDFGTPEQLVPTARMGGVDWESCITLNGNWGFNAHDKNFKSRREVVRLLVDVVSKGGNLLLNVGPDAEGEIPATCVERLAEVGAWMRTNAGAIHGCGASPLDPPGWGRITCRFEGPDTHLYLHVFDWPADGRLVVEALGNEVRSARLLADPSRAIQVDARAGRITLQVPGGAPDPDASVIELVIAGEPIPYFPPLIETESDIFLDETTITVAAPAHALEARYTLDGSEPTLESPVAMRPIAVRASTVVRARTFHGRVPVGTVASRTLLKSTPSPAVTPTSLAPGLEVRVGQGSGEALDAPWTFSEDRSIENTIALPASVRGREHVALRFTGFVRVEQDDVYTFRLESDDGSRLVLDGQVVCDNDGLHARKGVSGSIALAAGWHALELSWFNRASNAALALQSARGKRPLQPIAPENLAHAER